MQRKYIGILSGAVLILATLWLVIFSHRVSAKQPMEDSLPTVAVAPVEWGSLVNSITLSGEFRPFQQVDVHAKVAGFIRKIYVDVGDHVEAGQVLAILEVPELSAEVTGAKADIRRSQDAIRRAQSEIERSNSAYNAYHAAYTRLKQASEARPGLIAEQELDDSLAKDKEAEAQVNSSRGSAGGSAEPAVGDAGKSRPAVCDGSLFAHHRTVCRCRDQAVRRYRRVDSGRHDFRHTVHAGGAVGGVVEAAVGGPRAGIRSAATASWAERSSACCSSEPRLRREGRPLCGRSER